MKTHLYKLAVLTAFGCLLAQPVQAQLSVTETFNSTTTNADWYFSNGACLTASTLNTTITSGLTLPGCVNSSAAANKYYSNLSSTLISGNNGNPLPDPAGSGALRLTNGSLTTGTNGNNETGLIVGTQVLPSTSGIQISFNTVTYGGNGYTNSSGIKSGADGMSFFLLDASKYSASTGTDASGNTVTYYAVSPGQFGGSLGYDCSTGKGGGITGGYIGLGIDEYGNYVNKGDNGYPSDSNSPGTSPNTIGLRGAGSVNSASLNTAGAFFTNSPVAIAPINTAVLVCNYGFYTSGTVGTPTVSTYSGSSGTGTILSISTSGTLSTTAADTATANITWVSGSGKQTSGTYNIQGVFDYPVLSYDKLSGVNIYNQEATSSTTNTTPSPSRQSATILSYDLMLTSTGYLTVSYSINGGVAQNIMPSTLISASNGPIPANFLFGFAGSTGGGSNVHEITCFKAKQISDSSSSASGNIPENNKVQAGNAIYLASYNPDNWTGSVQSYGLQANANGSITINSSASWDANCVLTGTTNYLPSGGCPSGSPAGATSPTSRAIATWNDASLAGVTFSLGNLSANQQSIINSDTNGAKRISYLEGDRSNEATGLFRTRTSVLGDIIDSAPVWVGPPCQTELEINWIDQLYPSTTMLENAGQTYKTFNANNMTRLNVVYVGANDGMLHGFMAGSFSGSCNNMAFSATNNTGQEVLAYLPQLAVDTIHNTSNVKYDYSALNYAHNDFVDATPGTGDLFYGGAWHTWLVGGLGYGGQVGGTVGDNATTMAGDIYALDVTNVAVGTSATTVSNMVMGDWTSSTITCAKSNVAAALTACGGYMGGITGNPIIRRLHNGNWAAIFGNGLNSANGTAGIFIMEIANNSGSSTTAPTITFDYIDTGVGASTNCGKNGIAYVASADADDDHVVDYIYGGDALGNLWRFDLTGYNTSTKVFDWNAATTNATPILMFTTQSNTYKNSSGTSITCNQPITTAVAPTSIVYQGQVQVMVDFGTGRNFPQTLTASQSTIPGVQSLYGIWDWNMKTWDSLSTTQYAYSTNGPGGSPNIPSLSGLTKQTLTSACSGTCEIDTTLQVCYQGMTGSCATSPNPSWGWYINLPNTQTTSNTTNYEQVVYNPVINSGLFFVNTTIGASIDPLACTNTNASGFSYGVDAGTGGGTTEVFNQAANYSGSGNVVGLALSAVGTSLFVTATGTTSTGQTVNVTNMLYQTSSGSGGSTVVNSSAATGQRISWIELR